jgi:tetratricopeptide (TPR) repeat protein
MPGIFLCYRGIDRSYAPLLLDRELGRRFPGHVFQAARSNTPATDIPDSIRAYIEQCSVVIVVIDRAWRDDISLLFRDEDWIRLEITLALEHDRPILPLLLDGARIPRSSEVPKGIAAFTDKASASMTTRRLDADLDRLVNEIEKLAPEMVLTGLTDPRPSAWRRPADLLLPEYEVFPTRGRPESGWLEQWCADPDGHPVRVITGPASAGKTRLMRIVAARLRAAGWAAGPLSGQPDPRALAGLGAIRTPTLLVIDDAESRTGLVRTALLAIAGSRNATTRLVLIARTDGEWFGELRTDPDDAVAALAAGAEVMALEPLRPRAGDYDTAQRALAEWLPAELDVAPVDPPEAATLLEVQAAALAHLLKATHPDEPPLRRLAEREIHYWHQTATSMGLDWLRPRNVKEIITAVTLFGADTDAEADRLLGSTRAIRGRPVDAVDTARELIRTLLPGRAVLNPLRPGQLAVEIVAPYLRETGFPVEAISGLSDAQAEHALVYLGGADGRDLGQAIRAYLAADPVRLLPLAMTAVRSVPDSAELVAAMTATLDAAPADALVAALPQRSEVLARFAVDVTERALATATDPAAVARLSRLAATRLTYLGERPDQARAYARSAVAFEHADPEERAESLAVLALTLGPTPDGVAAGARAVTAFERLAPAGYRRDGALATALHNQSTRLSQSGDVLAALPLARRAHDLTTGLSAARRGRFLSLHADVQDHLATLLARSGELAQADAFGRGALEMRRTLAEARPDAYAGQVAATLYNLAVILRASGHVAEATSLLREAEAIHELRPGRDPHQARLIRRLLEKELGDG